MKFDFNLSALRLEWDRKVSFVPSDYVTEEDGLKHLAAWLPSDYSRFEDDASGNSSLVVQIPGAYSPEVVQPPGLDVYVTWPSTSRGVAAKHVHWIGKMTDLFIRRIQEDADRLPLRSVRFWIGSNLKALQSPGTSVLHVESGKTPLLIAEGVLADVVSVLVRQLDSKGRSAVTKDRRGRRIRWVSCTPESEKGLAIIIAGLAIWWTQVVPEDVISLCRRLDSVLTKKTERMINDLAIFESMGSIEKITLALEEVLAGLWSIRPLLGESVEADDELEGWQREIEVSIRQRLNVSEAIAFPGDGGQSFQFFGRSWPQLPDGAEVYVPTRRDTEVIRSTPVVPSDVFDGERTLVEAVIRLCIESSMSWDEALKLATTWMDEGRIRLGSDPNYDVPTTDDVKGVKDVRSYFDIPGLEDPKRSQSLLYFAYGSCMCRYSFRQTVPRYEVVGPACLKGYRLGFTHGSVKRKGGTADVIPDDSQSVWGILYRIPRYYLYRLDLREGVLIRRYERQWVHVELLGVPVGPALTYTVIDKAAKDIPPSGQYAGLIWDGAYGMLEESYLRELARRMNEMDVEPIAPL